MYYVKTNFYQVIYKLNIFLKIILKNLKLKYYVEKNNELNIPIQDFAEDFM
jgi:hypothetical protein